MRLSRGSVSRALVVATLALAGCAGSDEDDRGELSAEEQLRLCVGSRLAADEFEREFPDGPSDEVKRQVEEACRRGFEMVPTPPPPEAKRASGCGVLDPSFGRRARLGRRTAEAPPRPVPFFAPRAGAVPRTGSPAVGGVKLPRGSRCPHHWATDEPVEDPAALAARLADVFPETGLWPVIWDWPDDPDPYMEGTTNPDKAARLDPETVLRRSWSENRVGKRPFPGLAPGSDEVDSNVVRDPFGTFAESRRAEWPTSDGATILLVPATRPGEVISVLGMFQTELLTDEELTAVLLSWEERFAAVLTALGPGTMNVVAGAPPKSSDQAVRLAAEHAAFAPEDDAKPDLPSKHLWPFGWPD